MDMIGERFLKRLAVGMIALGCFISYAIGRYLLSLGGKVLIS